MAAAERDRFSLDDAEVEELARYAVAIEKHYGRPMDMEWAKDGLDGELYLVQARPETVASQRGAEIESFRLTGQGQVLVSGKAVGEKLWRLPLADSYNRAIDSDAADVKNIAEDRAAGSIIGAQFVQRFVNNVPWAHLDIAGVAWSKKDAPTVPKGATAFGVRLLDRFVAEYYEKR